MLVARLTLPALALAAAFATNAARAADYSQPPPQQVIYQQPQMDVIASSWYLRGDIGVSMQRSKQIELLQTPANAAVGFVFHQSSIGDSSFVGGGVGYEFNNWLRFDATAEYRSKSAVNAAGQYTKFCTLGNETTPAGICSDTYHGFISSWVFLANSYVDLGTWNCFTPFVGVGVGAARNSMSDFTDIGIPTGALGLGRNSSEWHLAYALHAGVAYNVSKTFKVELAYRYLNYGSITETVDCVGGCNPDSYKFGNLASHDIKLGFRWLCCDVQEQPRYVYQPQPYTPPPVYLQPPLRSKG